MTMLEIDKLTINKIKLAIACYRGQKSGWINLFHKLVKPLQKGQIPDEKFKT